MIYPSCWLLIVNPIRMVDGFGSCHFRSRSTWSPPLAPPGINGGSGGALKAWRSEDFSIRTNSILWGSHKITDNLKGMSPKSHWTCCQQLILEGDLMDISCDWPIKHCGTQKNRIDQLIQADWTDIYKGIGISSNNMLIEPRKILDLTTTSITLR